MRIWNESRIVDTKPIYFIADKLNEVNFIISIKLYRRVQKKHLNSLVRRVQYNYVIIHTTHTTAAKSKKKKKNHQFFYNYATNRRSGKRSIRSVVELNRPFWLYTDSKSRYDPTTQSEYERPIFNKNRRIINRQNDSCSKSANEITQEEFSKTILNFPKIHFYIGTGFFL